MEITSRSEARSRGLSQYFTGIPCRNGHVTYRYTQSGTCSGCIRSYSAPPEVLQQRVETRSRIGEMISFRARIHTSDLAFFRSIVIGASQVREPGVRPSDCWRNSVGTGSDNNTAVYTFSCFTEDVENLKQTALQLFKAHCVSFAEIERRKAEILRGLQKEAESENEWPEGDPR